MKVPVGYSSFCFSKKKQKRAPGLITAQSREAAIFNFCTTVNSTLVILLQQNHAIETGRM